MQPSMSGRRKPIGKRMPDFKTWDIVKVPFRYADRPVREWRPVLVIRESTLQDGHGLVWVLMITSARNQRWPGDVAISDIALAGLSAESVVRTAKIATIETIEAAKIGYLDIVDRSAVREQMTRMLEKILCNKEKTDIRGESL